MDLNGRYSLPARADLVWSALRDPEILYACIPGCDDVRRISGHEYQGRASVAVGPLKTRFAARVVWTELVPPQGFSHAARLNGEVDGGEAGNGGGETEVRLATGATAGSCVLSYQTRGAFNGRLAALGDPVLERTAAAMADEFFVRLGGLLRTGLSAEPADGVTPAHGAVPNSGTARIKPGVDEGTEGLRSQVWVVGLIGIVVILLALFSLVL